ncbi:VirB4 family type IV secretion/conjugal transfer ATPase [Aquabacterium soli]|uniref:VirB4 family type IV secretion/conjugal transfer ATPase n=1 Tax=Aquabacterium soli TaxID=2493092 RepID=A0A3R8YJZ5_9BURK|nr:VirB4 family type IV secretion/conjugal transfer ATPase [Aquabacterium soli]RRS01167.1 VirB4 family type IV secretion/conjugal transfer ATPase [Aquabacterium soli]
MFFKKSGDLNESKALGKGEVHVAHYIPMGVHIAPDVVKLRENGDVCATWRLHGIPFETASADQIASAKRELVNFLHGVRGSEISEPCAIWVHRVRRRFTDRLKGRFPNDFAQQLNDKYYDKLGEQTMLKNELYFTLLLRPTMTASGVMKKLRTRNEHSLNEFDAEVLERFSALTTSVEASLRKYGGERLTSHPRTLKSGEVRHQSEMLSFYRFLLTGHYEPVDIDPAPIYNYLCDARLFAGDTNGVVQVQRVDGRSFVGYLDFLDYPEMSEPGMNNCLFYGDYEFIETQSFSFLNKRDGVEALDLQRKRLVSGGEGSDEQIQGMNDALEDVRNGRVFMGEYHYSLGILGQTIDKVRKGMSNARAALQEDVGYKVATVDVIPECAHFAQLPGNWAWRPRSAKISSRNFACMSPMHNFDLGKRGGNPWGEAIAVLQTPARQPFYLNLHQMVLGRNRLGEKDPGNTFICGMTGTGKSVLLGFLVTLLLKVLGLRVLFFDKDRGAEILIRRLGGRYRQLQRGQPTGFNPFQWAPTESNIKFTEQLVMQCARRSPNEALPIEVENQIITSVRRVFSLPAKEARRISAIMQLVGENSEVGQRLAKWCRTQTRQGANAWVLDNAVDTTDFSGSNLFGFDYTAFLEDEEVGPIILAYILEAANSLIDGKPFVYVMEEFAKMVSAKSQALVEFARDKQTTIRKLNGLGVFVTQSPSQLDPNRFPIGSTIREQCVTQIYLPNPGADYADYVENFKLTETEFDTIKNLAPDSRCFLVKQGERSTVCSLDLYGFTDELEILTGTPESVELCEAVRKELKTDDPEVWAPVFLERLKHQKHTSKQALMRAMA